MKRLPFLILGALVLSVTACDMDKDNPEPETDLSWGELNSVWYQEQKSMLDEDGNPYYTVVNPTWSPSSEVLIHWYNDRSLTAEALRPLETSTVDVKYILHLCDGTPVDSSYTRTAAYGDSLFRTPVTGVINGWQIALQTIRVGDSIRLVIPYTEGYGTSASGAIPGYSTLQFDMKLVDVPYFEIRP